ncbi:MAG TPA: PAS domain-containing protein [Caulobacteraceae bacterium]
MADPQSESASRTPAAVWSILLAAGAGAATLTAMALSGGGAIWEAVGAAAVAALGVGLALRHRRARGPWPSKPARPEVDARPVTAPQPFEAMLQAVAEPILLVAGQPGGEPALRRFIFANRAARDLLGIHRDDGPMPRRVAADKP